jgi:hypothetical protein
MWGSTILSYQNFKAHRRKKFKERGKSGVRRNDRDWEVEESMTTTEMYLIKDSLPS